MEIKGDQIWHSPSPAELLAAAGQEITLKACVHNIRELGGIAFVVLRTGRYLIQSVYDKEVCPDNNLSQLSAGDCVRATGLLRAEPRAENGVELLLHGFTVLSRPASPLPLNLADKELKATLGTKMEYRTVALRHPRERAVFRIQQALACGFREFMLSQDFTEIHTPKITGIGAEGGAEVFELDYFGMPATLAQSPQMYKQTCVAFFDRVFEVGAVYRAELHNTSRHLNEYTGLDFEMGYIDGMEDVMQMETAMLQHTMAYVKEHCAPEIALLDVDVPRIGGNSLYPVRRRTGFVENARRRQKPERPHARGRSAAVRVLQGKGAGRIRVRDAFSHGQTSVLCDGRPAQPQGNAQLRPAVPRAGGDDRRPAHPRL